MRACGCMFASVRESQQLPLYIYPPAYEGVRGKRETAKGSLSDIARVEDRRGVSSPLHLHLKRVGAVALSECIIFDDLRGSSPRIPDLCFLASKSSHPLDENIRFHPRLFERRTHKCARMHKMRRRRIKGRAAYLPSLVCQRRRLSMNLATALS